MVWRHSHVSLKFCQCKWCSVSPFRNIKLSHEGNMFSFSFRTRKHLLDHSFVLSDNLIIVNPWLWEPVKPHEPLWQLSDKDVENHFTKPNKLTIQILWNAFRLNFVLTWSDYNFAHASTVQRLWHMQNYGPVWLTKSLTGISQDRIMSFWTRCEMSPSCDPLYNRVYGPLTRYAKLRVAHAPGMPGTFSPLPTSKETAS